jgi:hypothetical protein
MEEKSSISASGKPLPLILASVEQLAFSLMPLCKQRWYQLCQAFHGRRAVFEQLGVVLVQGYRLAAYRVTLFSQCVTHHAHFLKRLLEQGGHFRKGFLAFVTIRRRSGFDVQGGTLLVGGQLPCIQFLGGHGFLRTVVRGRHGGSYMTRRARGDCLCP